MERWHTVLFAESYRQKWIHRPIQIYAKNIIHKIYVVSNVFGSHFHFVLTVIIYICDMFLFPLLDQTEPNRTEKKHLHTLTLTETAYKNVQNCLPETVTNNYRKDYNRKPSALKKTHTHNNNSTQHNKTHSVIFFRVKKRRKKWQRDTDNQKVGKSEVTRWVRKGERERDFQKCLLVCGTYTEKKLLVEGNMVWKRNVELFIRYTRLYYTYEWHGSRLKCVQHKSTYIFILVWGGPKNIDRPGL